MSSRYFAARQITRLDPETGHQTQIITTRDDPDPAALAHAMFSLWRQENFFRYMRAHYGLDSLDAYATGPDDPARLVPNPARRAADNELRRARAILAEAEAAEGKTAIDGGRPKNEQAEVARAHTGALTHIAELEATAREIPAKVPLGTLHPDAARLWPARSPQSTPAPPVRG